MKHTIAGLTLGMLLWLGSGAAQALPVKAGHINDFVNALSVNTVAQLEAFLKTYEEKTGTDIYVLIVQDLEGLSAADYDAQLTEAWGLDDRHVLMLVSLGEGVIHLSSGDDVRDTFSDEVFQSVLDDMLALMAEGLLEQAVVDGVGRLAGLPAERQPGLFEGPMRLVILGGAAALSLVLYFLFLA